ncbi:AsmA protein [Marinimicrobium koreense]|uniref:AsmA protein n=1 Tax=Marinimicrobium koreense TaxID=306545 RepID=A0A3N1NS00_9GAMM|nr:AsmA family protein [Marinimicrobium koreense]ROQ17958.1 AsmA protein [Marinimicrobium koreense]
MKLLRRLFKVLVALVLLIVIAAVALVFVFDPNMFKPRLESLAQEQGVALEINGNLGWQLWPALGVEVNDIRVAAVSAPDDAIAELNQASLRLAIRPLLQGEVSVHHILIDGAALDLIVDEQGQGNWEALLPEESTPEQPAPEPATASEAESGKALQLAVEQITLSNASLHYRDLGTGQDLTLSPLNVGITGFNLQGQPFNLALGWEASIEDPATLGNEPLAVAGELDGRITLAQDFSHLELSNGRLRVELARAGASDDIRLTINARVDELLTSPRYQSDLTLEPFSPKALMAVLSLPAPELADPEALSRVAVSARVEGTTEQVSVDPLRLELDETTIEGRAAITDLSQMALNVALTGDRINIDHYLPPPSEEAVEEETGSTGDEPLIPLELIRSLDVAFGLDFGALTVKDLEMQDLSVRLLARDGVVNLERATLNAYQGRLDANARLDGTGETAVVDLVADLSGLELGPLLTALEFDEKLQLTGALNADVAADTRGLTLNELTSALDAQAAFSGAQVRLAPLNVEQKFCEIVNRVTQAQADPQKAWADYTEMKALSGKVTIQDQVIRLESLQAGVERLTLGAQGKLDMKQALYDFTLPMRLGSEGTSEGGCQVTSNYWLDRSLSLLRCRGSLDDLNPLGDCGLDSDGVQSLIKDFAAYKLKEQHGERIEAEKARAQQKVDEEKARAREKLDEEKRELEDRVRERLLGGDDEEATDESGESEPSAEERLKDLFRR